MTVTCLRCSVSMLGVVIVCHFFIFGFYKHLKWVINLRRVQSQFEEDLIQQVSKWTLAGNISWCIDGRVWKRKIIRSWWQKLDTQLRTQIEDTNWGHKLRTQIEDTNWGLKWSHSFRDPIVRFQTARHSWPRIVDAVKIWRSAARCSRICSAGHRKNSRRPKTNKNLP